MVPYNCIKSQTALTASQDWITIIAGATRSLIIAELDFQGTTTASFDQEIGIFIPTASGTGTAPTVVVPNPPDARYPAFGGTFYTGPYGTLQPVVPTVPIWTIPLNANGQRYFWRWSGKADEALTVPAAGTFVSTFSFRPTAGTGAGSGVTGRVKILEV